MICGLPFSWTVKSEALRPWTGLPLASVTITSTITSWALTRMMGVFDSGASKPAPGMLDSTPGDGGAAGAGVWAGAAGVSARDRAEVARASLSMRMDVLREDNAPA